MPAAQLLGTPLAPTTLSAREIPATRVRRRRAAGVCVASILGVVGLQIWAATNYYGLRVIGDTPTFLTLIRDMGASPMEPASTSFGSPGTESIHASPYLQVLGLLWRAVAPAGRFEDPFALGQFAAIVAIPMTLFVLGMLWLLVKQLAGSTAAHLSIPVLLMVFGPVHVAFPSDFSVNGFLYAGYYPTTFATGLMLAVLTMLSRSSVAWSLAAALGVALAVTTDPLNGAMLAALATVCACRNRREAIRVPLILSAGFLLAQAWPVFDVWGAFAEQGLPVPVLLAVAFVAPWAWLLVGPGTLTRLRSRRRPGDKPAREGRELAIAVLGALSAVALAGWGVYEMIHYPPDEPLLSANRLGFYWNDERYRWLLLFAPAMIGVLGMVRLARRGEPLILVWFLGFYVFGIVGAVGELVGFYVPLYYRFILLCQVPVAIGVAYFLARSRRSAAVTLTGITIACVLVFKVATLTGVSQRLTYFGADLPPVWNLATVVPPGSGVVASDPQTSYYFPLVTKNPILTVSPGHADSGSEPDVAAAGYRIMHRLYAGDGPTAANALIAMWRRGVRYIVVEKFTTFRPPALREFYRAPYSGLIERRDVATAARYNARLSLAGRAVLDSGQLTVYKLEPARFRRSTAPGAGIRRRDVPRVRALLASVPSQAPAGAVRVRRTLRRLGVQSITLSTGWLGSAPRLTAYGKRLRDPISVSVTIKGTRTRYGCDGDCGSARAVVRFLGAAELDDGIFTVIRLLPGGRAPTPAERRPAPRRPPAASPVRVEGFVAPQTRPPAVPPPPPPAATPEPAPAPDGESNVPSPQAPEPPSAPLAPPAEDAESSTRPTAPSNRPGRQPPTP